MAADKPIQSEHPAVVIYDANPVFLLEAELSLRGLFKHIRLLPLAAPAAISSHLVDPTVVLLLLDARIETAAYKGLATSDPRLAWMGDGGAAEGMRTSRPPRVRELKALPQLRALEDP